MHRRIALSIVLTCTGVVTASRTQAQENTTIAAPSTSHAAKQNADLQKIHTLEGQGGFICLQNESLFLTSDVRKNAAGYWFDLSADPRRPKRVSDALPGAWEVAVVGDHALVCDYLKHLTVYDTRAGRWQLAATLDMPSMTENIIVREQLALIANHTAGLTVVDISTPTRPAIVSNLNPQIDCDAIGL
jgi:hypothetical protein